MSESPPAFSHHRVSICMATYNGAQFIREQLESLAVQTLLPLELVITDDGSSDDTLGIIADFATTAPFPVRCYKNAERLGYEDNFLYAVSLCQGELISFCDQDDLWRPNKLARCALEFSDPEVLLCVHSGELFGDGVPAGCRAPHYAKREVFPPMGCYPRHGSLGFAMVFRRELLSIADKGQRTKLKSEHGRHLAHDQWVWFLGACFGRMVTLPEALVLYRQHGNNTFGANVPSRREFFRHVLKRQEYAQRAEEENRAAAFLEYAHMNASERWRASALIAAECFRRYAEINLVRAGIYAASVRPLTRTVLFLRVILCGGYSIGNRSAWLGWRAMLKDLALGVLRFRQA